MHDRKWQYKTVYLKTSLIATADKRCEQAQEMLNKLGAQGWELVTIETDASARFIAFLKKPL